MWRGFQILIQTTELCKTCSGGIFVGDQEKRSYSNPDERNVHIKPSNNMKANTITGIKFCLGCLSIKTGFPNIQKRYLSHTICTFIAWNSKPIKQRTRQKDSNILENFHLSAHKEFMQIRKKRSLYAIFLLKYDKSEES